MSCARSVRVFYEPGGGWDLVSSVRCLQVVISHYHVMPPSPAIEMLYSNDPDIQISHDTGIQPRVSTSRLRS